jgi:hypothetical protein
MNIVNTDNWTFCRYTSSNFMAFITFGADTESIQNERLDYFVTVLEDEDKEIFQEQFASLADACVFLNENYHDWTFENQTISKSGCSSCAAH